MIIQLICFLIIFCKGIASLVLPQLPRAVVSSARNSHRRVSYDGDRDFEVLDITANELKRQQRGINLIASENYISEEVSRALSSCFSNKYSEGLPGHRYYSGTRYVDALETLCQKRALSVFGLDSSRWHVNVQPHSGSPANLAVYTGLLRPGDRIMGLDLPSGGHLSHGYKTMSRNVSASSIFFNTRSYYIDAKTGQIDYDGLAEAAAQFRPHLIIAGASAYSRDWDYEKMKMIANSVDSFLMADISHISGFVLTGLANNPFTFCDVVTTTTHKSLRGPRSGLIFCKKEFEKRIDNGVFPGIQGGPHNNQIAAVAVALHEAMRPQFKEYIIQVRDNARALATALISNGYDIVTGGTDNHMILWSLRKLNMTGQFVEKIMEHCDVFVNRNSIFGDKSALFPSGIRLGTLAITTRGENEIGMLSIASILDQIVGLATMVRDRLLLADDIITFQLPLREEEETIAEEIRNRVHNITQLYSCPVCLYSQ